MLKWTLNGPRQSYLQAEDKLNFESAEQSPLRTLNQVNRAQPKHYTETERRMLKRKSSGCYALGHGPHFEDKEKENHMTSSTPLHSSTRFGASSSALNNSPLRKLDSLKDLSNIVHENLHTTPKARASPKPQNPHKTPDGQVRDRSSSMPKQYASTLPTFDVEYSPYGLIPGQLLALRGVGIADRYFEKPRYLTQDFNELFAQRASGQNTNTNKVSSQQRPQKGTAFLEDSTLSSSKMGDLTLDRMIDAILESTRKERKLPKISSKSNACHAYSSKNMSPTYTPADDPASDLHEFWDTKSEKYQQEDADPERTFSQSTLKKLPFNEREVRATVVKQFKKENLFQLRRQRAVRRKRKISTKLSASVKSSAQKLRMMSGAAAGELQQVANCKIRADKSADSAPKNESSYKAAEAKNDEKTLSNISPDSGRNSCSDLEDSTLEPGNNGYCEGNDDTKSSCKGLDATKRRLSFSTNINEI